ncbi:hypothetical protein PHMEG_00031695 [Phytophthora megakarya]|uniref:RxLR effector protein n=1 Tax=Phytophthora megakarya TaxID=4795 RepID=A0A225UXL9_9STRA|nr:hypothetical protein PHMEG_00031695 [Phytophthora megakarya]
MVDKGAPAADALKAFTVSKTADDVLDTPAWKEWAQYVIYRAVKKNDAPDEALGAAMSVAYTPAGLSSLVAKSMANPNTKTIAKALEQSQINRWLDGNYKPSAIFKTLSLEKTDDIFGSPAYGTFGTFLTAYNKKNPSKMVEELDVFRATFKEETIVKLLASADDSPAAVRLREQLIKGWMNEAEHPVNMFTRLKLHEAGDDLLTNPLLSTWVQYMKQFNEKYPKFESTMLSTFTKNYGDEKISLMIQAATKSDDKNIVEFAKNLQTAQFKRWMADDKTPKEMLSFFKLNTQTFLNDNPAADVWKAYNKAYTKENGGFAFQP